MLSSPVPLRKLYTSTSKMACPSPHAAARPASHVIHSHFARIESLLIDRERRRHRDAALVRERVRVRPESHVQTEGTQAHAPAEAELDPFALVTRHAAAHGDQAEALLAAHVHGRTPAGVQYVGPQRRLP